MLIEESVGPEVETAILPYRRRLDLHRQIRPLEVVKRGLGRSDDAVADRQTDAVEDVVAVRFQNDLRSGGGRPRRKLGSLVCPAGCRCASGFSIITKSSLRADSRATITGSA